MPFVSFSRAVLYMECGFELRLFKILDSVRDPCRMRTCFLETCLRPRIIETMTTNVFYFTFTPDASMQMCLKHRIVPPSGSALSWCRDVGCRWLLHKQWETASQHGLMMPLQRSRSLCEWNALGAYLFLRVLDVIPDSGFKLPQRSLWEANPQHVLLSFMGIKECVSVLAPTPACSSRRVECMTDGFGIRASLEPQEPVA